MRKLITSIFILASIASFGQDDKVELIKKDFLIKELQLTPNEVESFFSIYSEYTQKRKDARKSLKAERQSAMNESGSVDKIIDKEQDIMDLQKVYLEKLRKVVPEKKIVQLIEAEKKFKMMLMQQYKGK